MTLPTPRLVTWENGTDLVIEMPLDRDPAAVWEVLIDGPRAGEWFAPYAVDGDGVSFDLGDDSGHTELVGKILSCEAHEHVLVEFAEFGVLGIQLLAVEITVDAPIDAGAAGPETAAADAAAVQPEGTVLVFTQSSTDEESARARAADDGPMWDTHLRMFARSLGVDAPEASEEELLATYADLDLEVDADTEDNLGEGGADNLGEGGADNLGEGGADNLGEPNPGEDRR